MTISRIILQYSTKFSLLEPRAFRCYTLLNTKKKQGRTAMYYFIVNPGSRSGAGKDVWQKAEQILEQENVEYRVYFTGYRYHATRIAREITSRTDSERVILVAVGGDGTVNEVLNGITDFSRVLFGYLPTGSSNDFARCLGLPTDTEAAVRNLLHPSRFDRIDLGLADFGDRRQYFAVSCGCGFDAAVCHEALSSRMKKLLNRLHLGKLTYVGIALKQLVLSRPGPVTVITEGGRARTFSRAYFVSAMNCPCEGGGLRLAPRADAHDGLLDIFVVNRLNRFFISLMLPTAYAGLHAIFPGVHLYRARAAEFKSASRLPAHTDGEAYFLENAVKISCVPRVLALISAPNTHKF